MARVIIKYWPKKTNFRHLKGELEVIASEELKDIIANWGQFIPSEADKLRDYLEAEMSDGGMLSREHARESGHPEMGKIRAEARNVLKKLPPKVRVIELTDEMKQGLAETNAVLSKAFFGR